MTYEEKLKKIDSYFDNITSDEFNRICEEKYGIPSTADADTDIVSVCSSAGRAHDSGS